MLPLRSKIEPDIQEKLTVCARVFAAYKTKLNHRQRRASPPRPLRLCSHRVRYGRSRIWHARGIKETGGGVEWVWWWGGGDPFVIEASPLQFDLLPVNVPGIAAARLKKIGFRGG